MRDSCFKTNPLQRAGTTQSQRPLAALNPESIRIDEREIQDLIVFCEKFAGLLAYYDLENRRDGDWRPFIMGDLSTALARLVKSSHTGVEAVFRKYVELLRTDLRAVKYKPIFDILFSQVFALERMNLSAPLNTPIRADIENEIKGRMAPDLQKLIAFYQAGKPLLVDGTAQTNAAVEASLTTEPGNHAEIALAYPFSALWILPAGAAITWAQYLQTIPADATPYGDPTWPPAKRIEFSLPFISAMFNRIHEGYVRIIQSAQQALAASLESAVGHLPHNALLLAFLRLFRIAQDDLNRFTERHLNYYYREVLQLKEKPARPDSVHLIVDLAKNQREHLLRVETEAKDGKDRSGKEVVFKLDYDFGANEAVVAGLKTIFIDASTGNIFDAPVANSLDGIGKEKLDPEKPFWRTFGQLPDPAAKPTMRSSQIGFAIASPLLRLKEGRRQLTFEIYFGQNTGQRRAPVSLAGCLNVELSGEIGWVPCKPLTGSLASASDYVRLGEKGGQRCLEVGVTLDEGFPAVVDYHDGLTAVREFDLPASMDYKMAPGGTYATRWPVARIFVNEQAIAATGGKNLWDTLRDIRTTRIVVTTHVDELRSVALFSDTGALDPAQPFQPFGPQPKIGSRLYIGSHEALTKPLTSLNLHVRWLGLPPDESFSQRYTFKNKQGSDASYLNVANNDVFKAKVSLLTGGAWRPAPGVVTSLFENGTSAPVATSQWTFGSNLPFGADPNLVPFTAFSLNAKGGFLCFELAEPNGAFGHQAFPFTYAQQVIAISNKEQGSLPKEPYTPTIQSLALSYTAVEEIQFGANYNREKGQFFHLQPFGHAERRGETSGVPLLGPTLHVAPTGLSEPFEGALHVQIAKAQPGQNVSILLQVAEGTEDGSLDAPPVVWSFLSDNQWLPLGDLIVRDSTNQLLGSGILEFRVPKEANEDNTLVAGGGRWIRASARDTYAAFPQMIDVRAQAVRATFEDRKNDPGRLALPLPANSIAKLLQSDSAVKKIAQPFESFNGRTPEASDFFYIRVSERLRHKNRAITIWDYERLVLEEFPALHLVKCLNHTDDSTERSAGSVRVVVAPDMRNKTGGNKLEPSVSNNTREKIRKYLQSLNCPFVDLKVINPRYEAVQVRCQVAFREELDVSLHLLRLDEDLRRFLAPWAYQERLKVHFGGAIHRSAVVGFMENLPYVDFITDVSLNIYVARTLVGANLTEYVTSRSSSILTSYGTHDIGTNVCANA